MEFDTYVVAMYECIAHGWCRLTNSEVKKSWCTATLKRIINSPNNVEPKHRNVQKASKQLVLYSI